MNRFTPASTRSLLLFSILALLTAGCEMYGPDRGTLEVVVIENQTETPLRIWYDSYRFDEQGNPRFQSYGGLLAEVEAGGEVSLRLFFKNGKIASLSAANGYRREYFEIESGTTRYVITADAFAGRKR